MFSRDKKFLFGTRYTWTVAFAAAAILGSAAILDRLALSLGAWGLAATWFAACARLSHVSWTRGSQISTPSLQNPYRSTR
jgi:hypothetical protein